MKEVTEAVIEAVGADKTLLRFSAFKGIILLICGKTLSWQLKHS